ncbi:MAG TPA: glycosyltransferase [Chitinophagaceae bacterium]|nr:glycosyltransferase [Chitinophagaceae bacterium]
MVPAPPGISPGQRFRFEHYLSVLEEMNIRYRISPFYSSRSWKSLYKHGNHFKKAFAVLAGFAKRWIRLFSIFRYNYIYIYREAAPLGPPFFEWFIARVMKKRIIYDFDDSIWVPVTSEYNRAILKFKFTGKVKKICHWAYKVSVGNRFLENFARQYNTQVFLIPTVVNTENIKTKKQDHFSPHPAIGWTGTFSTLKYIDLVLPVLQELQLKYPFTFVVIAEKDPRLPLTHYRYIPWNRETEAEDLLNFHIGLMPLTNDEISKGKCGFKAIQYMSLGIPAVVSPVGVNAEIVEDGVNGFLCESPQDWKKRLEELLNDPAMRTSMGEKAKAKITGIYSVAATKEKFLELFT